MRNPIEFKKFLKALIDDRSVYNSLQRCNYSNAIMLLAPQDKATIDEGLKILDKMKKLLQDSEKHRVNNNFEKYSECIDQVADLNSEYMEVIPKVNPTLIYALLNLNEVQIEIQMLKKVFSLSYSVRSILGAYLQQDSINPCDYILGTLNVTLNVVDPSSEEADMILHYLNSENSHGYYLRNLIQVDDLDYSEEQNEKFYETKNHMMLWHGTSSNNILSIIREGLKIVPVNSEFHGARYGKGVYFSDSFALSSWFSTENNNEKYILICEVALGKMVNVLSGFISDLKKDEKYDSLRAMSSNGPDWDGFIQKNDVIYPIGNLIRYPQPEYTAYISDKVAKIVNRPTPLQAHFENKVKSQRPKISRIQRDKYEIDDEEESDEEEDSFEMEVEKDKPNYYDNKESEIQEDYDIMPMYEQSSLTQINRKGKKKVIYCLKSSWFLRYRNNKV